MTEVELPVESSIPNRTLRREWLSVILLTAALAGGTGMSLVLIQRHAVNFLTRVESEAAGPILASQLLQEQAWKHTRRVLASLDSKPAPLSPGSPLLRELSSAEDCFDRALRIDPRKEFDPSWAAAYGALSSLAEVNPRPARLAGMLAAAELTAGRRDTARQIATSATLSAHPDGFAVRSAMVLMEIGLQDRDTTEVRRLATLLEEQSPNDKSIAEVYRAEAALLDKDAEAAARHFEAALELNPRKPAETRYRLAETYIRLVRQSDATRVLADGLDAQTRRDPTYLHRTGIFLLADKRPAEAYDILEAARLLAPNNGDILWTQSRAAERSGQIRRAAKLLQQAVQMDPSLVNKTADKWP